MAYFKQLEDQLQDLLALCNKDERWLVVVNADPDSLASAMAFKRIIGRRVSEVGIAHINEVKRLDNLAMMHYLRIPAQRMIPTLVAQYDKFAILDSQPHHHPDFDDLKFSVIIDHHPLPAEPYTDAEYVDIRPKYAANCTMMTEYLYNLKIRPAKLLATALLYGIKTDTQSFERPFIDDDVKAFRYLTKYADMDLIKRITRSEIHPDWLRYFSRAFYNLRRIGLGLFSHIGKVENPDTLVILADFLMRVHGVSWDVVSGIYEDTLVVIFRGDGMRKDMGKMAAKLFNEIGSAGGHKAAARAEIKLEALEDADPESFVLKKLTRGKKTVKRI
ncbi:DHH family phosphoesterase [Maridesulfovibrio sp.]|uniref:DHH family phosphoesterase n=1 Tax=Maridesulfovibrio sp. TaxID=2795000 RepID=UPI0029F47A92|nr:DHH family phosphoesterase [Maridesulfovibrio sp.]